MRQKDFLPFLLLSVFALATLADPPRGTLEARIARLRDESIFSRIREIFFEAPSFDSRYADLKDRLLATSALESLYINSWRHGSARVLRDLLAANRSFKPSNRMIETTVRLRQALGVLVFAPLRGRFQTFVEEQCEGAFHEPDLMWHVEKLHLPYTVQHFANMGWLSDQSCRGKERPLNAAVIITRVALGEVYPAIAHDKALMQRLYKLTAHFLRHHNVNGFERLIANLHSALRANASMIRPFPRTEDAFAFLNILFPTVEYSLCALDEVVDFTPASSSESEVDSDEPLLDEHQPLPINALPADYNALLRDPLPIAGSALFN